MMIIYMKVNGLKSKCVLY